MLFRFPIHLIMKKDYTLLCLLFTIGFAACQTSSPKTPPLVRHTVVHLSENLAKETAEIPLSHAVASLDMIPLESKKECLIERISSMILTENDIIIYHHYKKPLFRFSRKGKFLNTIAPIGRGPQECTSIQKISYNPASQEIYVIISENQGVKVYTPDGKFIRHIPLNFYEQFASVAPLLHNVKGTFLWNQHLPVTNPEQNIWSWAVLDTNLRIKHTFTDPAYRGREKELNENRAYFIGWKNYWVENTLVNTYQKEFRMMYHGGDTIYRFDTTRYVFIPDYTLLLGERPGFGECREIFKSRTFYRYLWVDQFFDTKDYLYFTAHQETKCYLIEFDKHNGSLQAVVQKGELASRAVPDGSGREMWYLKGPNPPFKNDLTGIPEYFPLKTYTGSFPGENLSLISEGNYWVYPIDAYQLKEEITEKQKNANVKDIQTRDRFIGLLDTLTEESNPVLFIARLK